MEEKLITDPQAMRDELISESTLRPSTLADFVGQNKVKENLAVFIEAAGRRGEQLDHVLLYGPPGLGKTTLAHIIASELGVHIRSTSGPVFQSPADLLGILTQLEARDVVFIDEIHRL
ncbi:MAG: AAA family ATPase, partial [Candidatus Krumholzibacteria bacterium]|nr:AAA family ATPase [Candidatus Krumholzibacteria bacterium]